MRERFQLRVLVAEDNLINQEVTVGMLADLGCTAMVVPDGQLALEALARESFDVVLMDCQMPVMDGFESTRELRRREADGSAHQLVIALTANATAEDREACRVSGMDDFLSKPFQRRELAALLQRHVPGQSTAIALPGLTTAIATIAPSAEILDRRALDRIRAVQRPDRPDLVRRVLQIFLERSPVQLAAIAEAATAGDAHRLASAAHDMKGGSGNLGLAQVAELLARIEQLAKQGQLAEAAPLVSQLPVLAAAATVAVRGELERGTPTTEPHHA
jgi:CheY-like chemotaxis protein/HPt (histidine-containing phosphotransfer) domain-containing protein